MLTLQDCVGCDNEHVASVISCITDTLHHLSTPGQWFAAQARPCDKRKNPESIVSKGDWL